jgi:phospholipid/cholesterol/gamma-HCH transport system substrate-binding protein
METNVNYTIVGAFVLIIVTFLVLATIWLSSGFNLELFNSYMIYMKESVTGLSIDSSVEFNGVDAGSVKSIKINKDNPDLVELQVNIKSSIPISVSTVATLKSKGVTGVTYISLTDNGLDLTPLVAKKGEKYPIIKTIPSLLVRLDMALSRLSDNLHEVTLSIRSVLDKDNQNAIKNTLKNLDRITTSIAANDRHLNVILQNTANASEHFIGLTSMMQTQLLPKSYDLLANLNNMSITLTQVAAEIKQNPSMLVRGKAPPTLGPGESK